MALENTYLETQIMNQIHMVENFKSTCKMATLKDIPYIPPNTSTTPPDAAGI